MQDKMIDKNKKFIRLYKAHFKYVFGYIFRRINSIQDAEDVAAETFKVLWENIEEIDMSNNAKAWIYQTAVHKLNDYLRNKYKIGSLIEVDIDTVAEIVEYDYRTDKKAKYLGIMSELISNLSKKEQEFIDLKYIKGKTNREVAKALNITINNAKVINNRLLKKLHKLWQVQKM